MRKQSRGAVLGWLWFLIKPVVYVFCFWFALEVGIRASRVSPGDYPYILWLSAGMAPWFFMQVMLSSGVNAMHKYPYLVKKIKFPISCIPTIIATSGMVIQFGIEIILFILYFACGMPLDIYLLQIPILLALMYAFWCVAGLLFSIFSACSKDFYNFIGILHTPLFWLSGVIFKIEQINNDVIQTILWFNPVTFFVRTFRGAICDKTWFWENPPVLIGFIIVFALTFVVTAVVYKRACTEVADVL